MSRLFYQTVARLILVAALSVCRTSSAQLFIHNGNFEAGTLDGWLAESATGSSGRFHIHDSSALTPISGLPAAGPSEGSFYAISDSSGPGMSVLATQFTMPATADRVWLTFDMFVNDWSGTGPLYGDGTMDFDGSDIQHIRVDLLRGDAGLFDIGDGVLANLVRGLGKGPISYPQPYMRYEFDVTSVVAAGGQFMLRFLEMDNQYVLNLGVDDVRMEAIAVPEPAGLACATCIAMLLGIGLLRASRRIGTRGC